MPRLPGSEALGNLPSMRTGIGPAQISGKDPVADSLGRVGQGIVALSEDQRQREDALQAAEADARLTTGLTELRRRFDSDPNWQTFQPRFEEEAARVRQEAGGLIRNPRLLERWNPRADVAISGAFDHVRGRQDRLRGEHEYDRLDRTLGELGSSYVTAPDDTSRETIRRNIEDTIELGRRSGVVQAERIRDLTRRHLHGTIEADALARHSAGDGYAALIELREGDARAQQPSSGQVSEIGLGYIQRLEPRPAGQTPTQIAAANRRLRTETAKISEWITGNVTVPLTQLQHDALVGVGVRRGRDALAEMLPSINEGNWDATASAIRAGGMFAAETAGERPAAGRPAAQRQQRTPVEIAQEFVGTNERQHTEALSEFFRRSGGQRLSPAETAWCAAFVNAALGATGTRGTGTLAARDFLRFGTETRDPQVGDIVVLTRGDPNGMQGHVGFYMGRDEQGRVRVLGGNQGQGEVSIASFDPQRVLGYRTPPRAGTPLPGVDLAQYQPQDPHSEEMAEMLLGQAPSSRYRNLPPQRRRVLANQLSESLRNETRAEVESDIESIRRTGEPRTLPDGTTWISRANRILVPNQAALVARRVQEAYAEFRAQHGLTDMTPEQMELRLDELSPGRVGEGENYAIAARVRDRTARTIGRIQELRQRDPALAVSGTQVTGGHGGVRADASGQLFNVPAEDDLRVRPAQEVAAAFTQLQRRRPDLQIQVTETGEIVAAPASGQIDPARARPQTLLLTDQRLRVEDRHSIIEARLAAQARLGVPEVSRRALRRDEAAALLNMPQRSDEMTNNDFSNRLRAAADRAIQLFGTRYGRAAFRDAIAFRANLSSDQREEARAMMSNLPGGEYMTPQDMQRLQSMQNLNREEAMWRYGVPVDNAVGRYRIPSSDLEAFGVSPTPMFGLQPTRGTMAVPQPSEFDAASYMQSLVMAGPEALAADRTRREALRPGRQTVSPTPGRFPKPPPEEIQYLLQHPQIWQEFEKDYGPGSAGQYLQESQRGARGAY